VSSPSNNRLGRTKIRADEPRCNRPGVGVHIADHAIDATAKIDVVGLSPLARLGYLNGNLLSHDSATLPLEHWCDVHRLASPARIVAVRVPDNDKPVSLEQRRELSVTPGEPIRYRRVRLLCGTVVLSEADNWYVPSDSWVHDIRIEATLPIDLARRYPVCVGGKCSAPPEDCGGPNAFMENRWRYEAMGNGESREELEGLVEDMDEEEWEIARRYDPGGFDRRAINQALSALASSAQGGSHHENHDSAVARRHNSRLSTPQEMDTLQTRP
jgi:Plasmid pRiA4b ORF-3-like protein